MTRNLPNPGIQKRLSALSGATYAPLRDEVCCIRMRTWAILQPWYRSIQSVQIRIDPVHVVLPAAARRVRPREGPYLRMRLAVAVPGGAGPRPGRARHPNPFSRFHCTIQKRPRNSARALSVLSCQLTESSEG